MTITATVTAGNTATIDLGPFSSITMNCSGAVGTLAFTSSAGNLLGDFRATLQNKTYGPYGVPTSLLLTVSQGSATYTVTQGACLNSAQAALAPLYGWKRSGTTSSPLVSLTGATFGDLAPPDTMVIPANTLAVGSVIEMRFKFWKSGSNGAATPTPYFGTTNNTNAQALFAVSLAAAATHIELITRVQIASATAFTYMTLHNTSNVGVGGTNGENTNKCDITAPMYVFAGVSVMNASDTLSLVGYSVNVFP